MINKVTIIGLGLIGGSLGLALQKNKLVKTVVGVPRRLKTIDEALNSKAIAKGTINIAEGVRDADVIFICTPISSIITGLKNIVPYVKQGAIITDVGSTKQAIIAEAEKVVPAGVTFIAGHPMAGREKTGIRQAKASLFEGKPYVLIKTKKTNILAYGVLKKLISGIGGKTMEIDAKTHDLAVAAISHVPIVVAASLVNAIVAMEEVKDKAKKLASTGFGDTTRIASGDPKLGLDIFKTNAEPVLAVLQKFKNEINVFEKAIRDGREAQLVDKLSSAKRFRDSIYT